MTKRHQCNRCKRRTDVVIVQKKSGALKTLCEGCLETIDRKHQRKHQRQEGVQS